MSAARENESVVIEVRDTGPGISPADLQKIFIPFFTTKAKGHGIGLALTHRIITQHGGTLTAANAPEGGAVFTINLGHGLQRFMNIRFNRESAASKIFLPPAIDEGFNIFAHNQLIRKTGLRARIDHDRRLVDQMMSLHRRPRRINIRRRLEARPRGPQKIRRRSRHARIIMQDNQRPLANTGSLATLAASDSSSANDAPCNTKHPPQNTSAREIAAGNCPRNSRGNWRTGSPKPKHDRLAAFIHLPARVIERVHRHV